MMYSQDVGGLALSFVHRRVIGGVRGFLTGGPVGAVAGALTADGGGGAARIDTRSPEFSGTITHIRHGHGIGSHIGSGAFARAAVAAAGPAARSFGPGFGPGPGPCPGGGRRVAGICVDIGAALPGGDPLFSMGVPAGEAVMGRFGAALTPVEDATVVRRCLRGMVLGNDGLCYNKRDIRNNERWWPRGRRPLLTGGEMRAISVASRAAGKLETKTKQLRKMGMLKPLPKARRITSGPTAHHHHTG